jgi:hypothetical protein
VLRALIWLGGHHRVWPSAERPGARETEEQARLVQEVRGRTGVAERLRALAASEDLWVREAARLAQEPDDVK